jgi:zinc protease
VLTCWLAWFAGSAHTADAPAAPQKVVTIEGITEYRLDNGLRVLLFPDDSASDVTVNLTVFVGSRHEGYGETGMAHLLEHMLFKGTPTHRDIPRLLKQRGATFNGTTWVDRTNYYESMEGTDDNLEFAVRLEADRMVNSFIKREDLASEMTVVRSEFEAGENSPERILSQRMMAVAYEWHNYGKNTIGNRSDIERVPIDKLRAFYKKYYRPDNAMLVVAGKFKPARALEYVRKYFSVVKKPARKLDATYTDEPAQDGERTVVLRRVGKVGVVGVLYHIPAGAHADFPAVEVLTQVLVSAPSGRLYKALVETKKATGVSGRAAAYHDPGVLEISAQVEPKNSLKSVRDTLIDVLENLDKNKITADEVNRARRRLLKNRELLMTRTNQIGVVLSEWGALGDWRLFFLHRDRLAKVTADDVARVAAAYLKTSNRTVGLFIPTARPERTRIPPPPDVAELVKGYQAGPSVTAGEAFDPTPENIEKHVQRSKLSGGLKVALLPKKSRGGAVVAVVNLRFGNEKSLGGITSATQFLGPLLARGTKKHTRQEIQDELDKLGARLMANSTVGELTVFLETKRENLPAVLRLLGEVLREPTFPAAEFDVLKRSQLAGLQRQLTEPQPLAVRALQRKLNPYPRDDIRYVPTVQESIDRLKKVTRDTVAKLYNDQLGAQNGEVVVVGDFDPESTDKQVRELLGDWKAHVAYKRIPRPALTDVKGGREEILTPDKRNAVYLAGQMLPLKDTDPAFPALRVANFLFGEGGLSSRLANRVRQEEGLSYGVGSFFSADAEDKSARFLMFAICNPNNMGKVDRAIAQELNKLLKKGVKADELKFAKDAYLKQLKRQRTTDTALATLLAENLYLGRTFAYYRDLEKKIDRLTEAEVNQAVQKYLQPKKLVIIQAGDFKKGEKPRKDG